MINTFDTGGFFSVYVWPIDEKRAKPVIHISINTGSLNAGLNLSVEETIELIEKLTQSVAVLND